MLWDDGHARSGANSRPLLYRPIAGILFASECGAGLKSGPSLEHNYLEKNPMKASVIKWGISAMLLLFTVGTVMAAPVQIVSLGPEKIHAGKKTTITVTIQNDSDSACRVTLEPSAPKGCSLKPLQPDIVSFRGYYTPAVPAKGSFDAKFELSFTESNLSGGFVWAIKEYGRVYDGPQLDAKTQTIVPKVGIDQWVNKFRDRLKTDLENGTGGFRETIEKLYNLCHYDGGSVDEVNIATVDGSSDTWEDGYNISRMKARLVFNWHRAVKSTSMTPTIPVPYTRNWTKLTVVFNIDPTSGSATLQRGESSMCDVEDSTEKLMDYAQWATVVTAFTVAIKGLLALGAAAAAAGS